MQINFTKMHGIGNDFVVIDAINQAVSLSAEQVRAIADRHFGVGCDQLLLVHAGGVAVYDEALDAYPAWITSHNRLARQAAAASPKPDTTDRRERKRREAQRRQAQQPVKQALDEAESALARLQAERETIETELADATLYEAPAKKRLQVLLKRRGVLEECVAQAEEHWLTAAEALEAASRTDAG